MTYPDNTALSVELCAPSVQPVRWNELGYAVHPVNRAIIEACEAEPTSLQHLVCEHHSGPDPALLVVACDQLPATRAIDTPDWNFALHEPLTRCFTVLRGLVPWIARHPRGGHIVALLSRTALLPDATQGSGSVLGRALVGLFEALRAELRQTPTRVSICITDDDEPAQAFHERLRHILQHRSFHSLPASIDRETIENYFTPLLEALSRTPPGTPMPAGPQGEVYRMHSLEMN